MEFLIRCLVIDGVSSGSGLKVFARISSLCSCSLRLHYWSYMLLLYISKPPDVIYNFTIKLMIVLCMWSGIRFVATTRFSFWTWIWPTRRCRLGHELACWLQTFLKEKSSFKMVGLSFCSKLDWGSYIVSIAKTGYKKAGA